MEHLNAIHKKLSINAFVYVNCKKHLCANVATAKVFIETARNIFSCCKFKLLCSDEYYPNVNYNTLY